MPRASCGTKENMYDPVSIEMHERDDSDTTLALLSAMLMLPTKISSDLLKCLNSFHVRSGETATTAVVMSNARTQLDPEELGN
jgi:hypothetical protein